MFFLLISLLLSPSQKITFEFHHTKDASFSETIVTLKVQIDILIEPYIQAHDVTFQLS